MQVDLNESTGSALPFESLGQLRILCVSPDGLLLLAIDVEGKALLINRKRQVLLHHFSFKGPVAAAKFSPDGQFIACAVQRLIQVSTGHYYGLMLKGCCLQCWGEVATSGPWLTSQITLVRQLLSISNMLDYDSAHDHLFAGRQFLQLLFVPKFHVLLVRCQHSAWPTIMVYGRCGAHLASRRMWLLCSCTARMVSAMPTSLPLIGQRTLNGLLLSLRTFQPGYTPLGQHVNATILTKQPIHQHQHNNTILLHEPCDSAHVVLLCFAMALHHAMFLSTQSFHM